MTLKPNYPRAMAITYLWVALFSALAFVANGARAVPAEFGEMVSVVLFGGTFMAIAVSVMFVPRELSYDSERFSCRMIVQGSHTFGWDKLVAYGSGNAVFLLKFEGQQAIQISSFGFQAKEWKAFRLFLKQTFPERKCWVWLGPNPLKRKK